MTQRPMDYLDVGEQSQVILRFRNYVPRDVVLRRFCLPRPSVDELEKQIDREATDAINSSANEDVVAQIAPRRPNWDLKRDVEKKLAVLSRKTDMAIVDLIRMKIKNSGIEKPVPKVAPVGAEEVLSHQDREIAHSLVNAMRDLEQIEDEERD
ncbi:UNVERIFIED_CONTAM: cwf18 pre-mRNA splicing factor protein [Hammondia hammondi]|eukprot:XP_008887726.1 cwf18 pre-mRNA splicing factor protein [Hammondia hammondi]